MHSNLICTLLCSHQMLSPFCCSYRTFITFTTITINWCIVRYLGLKRPIMFSMRGVLLFMAGFWFFSQCLNRVSSSDPLFVQGFQKICDWSLFEYTADLSIALCEWKMKLHWKSAKESVKRKRIAQIPSLYEWTSKIKMAAIQETYVNYEPFNLNVLRFMPGIITIRSI